MGKARTSEEWNNIEKELNALKEQRKEISKKIRELNIILWRKKQHEYYYGGYKDYTQTRAYKMFGKRLKDLNESELKEYRRVTVAERRKELLAKKRG